jgi:hypothetical protein
MTISLKIQQLAKTLLTTIFDPKVILLLLLGMLNI